MSHDFNNFCRYYKTNEYKILKWDIEDLIWKGILKNVLGQKESNR